MNKQLKLKKGDDNCLRVEVWHLDTGEKKEILTENAMEIDLYTNGSKEISFFLLSKEYPHGYKRSLTADIQLINFSLFSKSAGISGTVWISTVWERRWRNANHEEVEVSLTDISPINLPNKVELVIQL